MYLRTKFQVSSAIVTSFRHGVILPFHITKPLKPTPKKLTQIRVKSIKKKSKLKLILGSDKVDFRDLLFMEVEILNFC